jgi:uncharacterized membrane protein YozB (DUF420 family)
MVSRINSAAVPPARSRISTGKNRLSLIFFLLMAFSVVCSPALALPPHAPGAENGQSDQGIFVYWPYHAFLMVTGFLLLLTGFYVAHYHKTKNWYRTHFILQVCGGACILAGLAVGVSMVALSGFPPLKNIHELLGAVTVLLVVIALVLGYSIRRVQSAKNIVRESHRWLGRIVLCLMVVTIFLGIFFLSLLLGR